MHHDSLAMLLVSVSTHGSIIVNATLFEEQLILAKEEKIVLLVYFHDNQCAVYFTVLPLTSLWVLCSHGDLIEIKLTHNRLGTHSAATLAKALNTRVRSIA